MKNVDKNNRQMDNKGNVVRKRMKWLSRQERLFDALFKVVSK